LLQKLSQYWADLDIFRNHNPKFSGASEHPEENFFRQKKSQKKEEWSFGLAPLYFFGGFFLSGTHGAMHNVIF